MLMYFLNLNKINKKKFKKKESFIINNEHCIILNKTKLKS